MGVVGGARSLKTMSTGLKFEICMAPVRRVTRLDRYKPSSYELALVKLPPPNDHTFQLLSEELPNTSFDYEQLVLQVLRDKYNILANLVQPVTACDRLGQSQNVVSLFFVVPIGSTRDDIPTQSVEFINLEDIIEQPGQVQSNNRDFLLSLDQWLSERHSIPSVNLDLMFSSDPDTLCTVGVIQQTLTNPLKDEPVPPKEESLVLSFNNPIFPANNT